MASNAGVIKNLIVVSHNRKRILKAGETIQEGELLGAAVGPIVATSNTRHALKIETGRGKRTKIESQNMFKHIQVSESPNVVCRNGLFFATRQIRKNAPITM
jgi:hypothetical protein